MNGLTIGKNNAGTYWVARDSDGLVIAIEETVLEAAAFAKGYQQAYTDLLAEGLVNA